MNYSFYKQAASLVRGNLEKSGESLGTEEVTPKEQNSDSKVWDQAKVVGSNAAHYGLSSMPFLFMDNHPSMEQSIGAVDEAIAKNKELWNAARSGAWRNPTMRGAGSVLGRTLGGLVLPGVGIGFTYPAAKYHFGEAAEDPSAIGKAVGYTQGATDIALGGTDLAYLAAQIPGLAKRMPWLKSLAARGFRYAGPVVGYSALWDLGNAYRKAQEEQLEAAVGRQEQREEDYNNTAALGSRVRDAARTASRDLGDLKSVAEDNPGEKEQQDLNKARKSIATNLAILQSQSLANQTDPLVFGSTKSVQDNPGPLKINISAEHPTSENKSYTTPAPKPYRPPLMYATPPANQPTQFDDAVKKHQEELNSQPTTFTDTSKDYHGENSEETFTPEYYADAVHKGLRFNPTDYLPWRFRPFLGSAAPIPETSDNFKEDVNTGRSKFWNRMNDAMMKAQDSGF